MKKLMLLVPFLCMLPVATGEVSTRVCFADGNTPFLPVDSNLPIIEYPDIMVGTKLTIIVDSNAADYWSGSLAIEDANMDYGVLSCRECNDMVLDCDGSRFPQAGEGALVLLWEESGVRGYDLYTDSRNIMPGDWFIIDYEATSVGICEVGFYDHSVDRFKPIYYLTFSHVPTRDFNDDTNVDFADFAVLALYWGLTNCDELDWCDGVDLNTDRIVDFIDVMLFTDYWLENTDRRCFY